MVPSHDAGDVARMLAQRAPALALELLPAGRRDGAEWRVGSLAGERGASLGVHLHGNRAGVWCDFASGERGDALDLVAAVLYAGDKGQALRWARVWLGLADERAPNARRRAAPAAPPAKPDPEAAARSRAAQRLFLSAEPALAGTPAAAYLLARGIDLAELGRQPRSLRFHPGLTNRESGRNWPALVAAVTNQAGAMIAVHRTWLHQVDDGHWTKAPLAAPKMALGGFAGGCIRLWRGGSGKPLAHAPIGETVVIGEGIETCLSVAIYCPELRVLCAISLSNMAGIVLPAAVQNVILAADNDGDNAVARRALQAAINHFAAAGRVVRVARSPLGKDFNDALRMETR